MTIVTSFFLIEHAMPDGTTEPDKLPWTMMKTEFPTDKAAEKKVDFFRNDYPGHDWRIWKKETRMTLHSAIESPRRRK